MQWVAGLGLHGGVPLPVELLPLLLEDVRGVPPGVPEERFKLLVDLLRLLPRLPANLAPQPCSLFRSFFGSGSQELRLTLCAYACGLAAKKQPRNPDAKKTMPAMSETRFGTLRVLKSLHVSNFVNHEFGTKTFCHDVTLLVALLSI